MEFFRIKFFFAKFVGFQKCNFLHQQDCQIHNISSPFFNSLLPISTSWGINWRFCSASKCPKIWKLLNINETVPHRRRPWLGCEWLFLLTLNSEGLTVCSEVAFYKRKAAAVCLMGFDFGLISSKHSRGSIPCNYFSLNDWWGRQKQIAFSDHMSGSGWRWTSQSSSP